MSENSSGWCGTSSYPPTFRANAVHHGRDDVGHRDKLIAEQQVTIADDPLWRRLKPIRVEQRLVGCRLSHSKIACLIEENGRWHAATAIGLDINELGI